MLLTNSGYDKEQRMPEVVYGHMRGNDEGKSAVRHPYCARVEMFEVDASLLHAFTVKVPG